MNRRTISVFVCLLFTLALILGSSPLYGAQKTSTGAKPAVSGAGTQTTQKATASGGGMQTTQQSAPSSGMMGPDSKRVTQADRKAEAARNKAAGAGKSGRSVSYMPGGTPDYFGTTPNYANSQLPTLKTVTPVPTFFFAEGTLRPNFDTYLCIENPGLVAADVTITYMKGNGTTDAQSLSVPGNSRFTVNVKDRLGTADDLAHDFSSKVECTNSQQICVERPMYFNYHGKWTGGHDVVGATSPSSAFYFAEGTCRPDFDPWICIQNPGADDAQVKITYMKGDGPNVTDNVVVTKHTRLTVDPRLKLGTGNDPAHDFSSKVECTNGQNIVAERPMYFNYHGIWTGGSDAVGALSPMKTFYFAEGTSRPNFDPWLCIQNPGGNSANVTITYMKGDGSNVINKVTVPKNSRMTIDPRLALGTANDAAHDFSAKVECTNDQLIIAERPMYFNYNGVWTGGHDVVGTSAPQTVYNFAEGTCRPNFDPYLSILNAGNADATVKVTYLLGNGAIATDQLNVRGGSRATVTPRTKLGTGNDAAHDFSSKVECTNGQQIVAERPMYFNYNGAWTGGHDTIGFTFDAPTTTAQSGTGIRKFVDSLPGLGAANANDLGQYIPVAVPDQSTFTGSDYYEIELGQYTEQLHKDLPPTTLRGYRQTNTSDSTISKFSYLGPAIVAQKDRPVRVKFTNNLPTGSGGNLFIPVDPTVMGAGMGPTGGTFTQNRATLHLHGGNTPWISDGTPNQWITPAGEGATYPKGVSVKNVPDMPDPGPGSETFFYTNQQSARLMFYHDHAYGITRLNVYAGEAAPYLVTDSGEQSLVNSGAIPADQIPLVIQDKTFVPDFDQLNVEDPTWDISKYGGTGSLWFPHVYMPNQNPESSTGASAMGRWDYGPWFWPPFTGIVNGPVNNPYYDPVNAPWEPRLIPGTPNPTIVPEAFMDTPLVNGTAYPYVKVGPKAYRFRILNASNDRTLNLQLYFAKSNGEMWNPSNGTLRDGDAGEVNMVPAVPNTGLPPSWPVDGRDGGVPDPTAVGPDMIQIGTEGGFLPQAVDLPNTPVGYDYNRRNIVVLNVLNKTLFLGPAERADVVIDFSGVPDGSKLILYNDAPAPVPGFDPRYDYYTGDPDLTSSGGAPSTVAGYGPNTRTVMQFQVTTGAQGGMTNFNLDNLKGALPTVYGQTQAPPLVPQSGYNVPFGANWPTDAYVKIQDTQMTINNGVSYVTLPLQPKSIIEDFDPNYGRMNALLGMEVPRTTALLQTSIPYFYIDPPTETLSNTNPASLIGTVGDGTQIWKITHNGVDTHSMHWHMFNVQLINRVGWDGAVRPPDANELGWKEVVRMNPLEDAIVALRPIIPNVPFELPNSIRSMDVTSADGTTGQFHGIDPSNEPAPVINHKVNYGWEYVWHCHLLGHEENDMMRPMAVAVSPLAPLVTLAPTYAAGPPPPPTITVHWTDNSLNESNWVIERSTSATGPWTLVANFLSATPDTKGVATNYTEDVTALAPGTYFYRVTARNTVGDTTPYLPPASGYPTASEDSTPVVTPAVARP